MLGTAEFIFGEGDIGFLAGVGTMSGCFANLKKMYGMYIHHDRVFGDCSRR